ncbi:MAG: hypothetical protein ACYDA1_11065, partial [Vulcanimicrobiaceae bacterium]
MKRCRNAMDVRYVQLLASFITARSEYVLARLEFASYHADIAAPPPIDRLPDASEATLQSIWPTVETQVQRAVESMRTLTQMHADQLTEDRQFHR